MSTRGIAEIDAELAALKAELDPLLERQKALLRERRPLAANAASVAKRQQAARDRNARIVAEYGEKSLRGYGRRKALAMECKVSVRQLNRVAKPAPEPPAPPPLPAPVRKPRISKPPAVSRRQKLADERRLAKQEAADALRRYQRSLFDT